jgi:hypothetical protein
MSKDLNATIVRRQEELLQLLENKGQIAVDDLHLALRNLATATQIKPTLFLQWS